MHFGIPEDPEDPLSVRRFCEALEKTQREKTRNPEVERL
jgi:hypothetical protein